MRAAAVTWQYPISPDGGRAGVYWRALGPSARTSGGRFRTATLLPLLVAKGVLSHTLTFECVGHWESFESSQRRCGGAMHRQLSAAFPVCTRAVAGSEPDVLVSLLSAPATTTSLAIPWCTTAWCGSRLPMTAILSVYPAFSCTVFGLSAELLVSQGWASTAYSCI